MIDKIHIELTDLGNGKINIKMTPSYEQIHAEMNFGITTSPVCLYADSAAKAFIETSKQNDANMKLEKAKEAHG
jgi:hypothetical protein